MDSPVYLSEECVVCLCGLPSKVFLKCRHCCSCDDCTQNIVATNMECPLCRSKIERNVDLSSMVKPDSTLDNVSQNELTSFSARRDDYIKRMRQGCTKNAGYTGKSKLAKSVAREIGDELEEREKERLGSNRCLAKNVEFSCQDTNLKVSYKIGRKVYSEDMLLSDWDTAKTEFIELMSGDTISVLDMATHYADHYWLWRYYSKNVENALVQCGLIQNKRRRN